MKELAYLKNLSMISIKQKNNFSKPTISNQYSNLFKDNISKTTIEDKNRKQQFDSIEIDETTLNEPTKLLLIFDQIAIYLFTKDIEANTKL